MVGRQLIGELDPCAAVGGTAGFKTVDRFENRLLAVAAGRRQHQAGAAGVDDDRHAVAVAEFTREQLERLADQRQLVLLLHRAGDVDEKHQVARGTLFAMYFAPLQADAHQHVVAVPRAAGSFRGDAKRIVAGRLRIVVGEVVDEFFEPHGGRRGQLAGSEIATHVGVAGRVDVDREGRKRSVRGAVERILGHRVVGFGVHRPIAAADRIDAGFEVKVALVFRETPFQLFGRFRFAPGFRADVGSEFVGELLQIGQFRRLGGATEIDPERIGLAVAVVVDVPAAVDGIDRRDVGAIADEEARKLLSLRGLLLIRYGFDLEFRFQDLGMLRAVLRELLLVGQQQRKQFVRDRLALHRRRVRTLSLEADTAPYGLARVRRTARRVG